MQIKKITLLQLRRQLPRIIDALARGDSFVIERYGTPVGVLVPIDAAPTSPEEVPGTACQEVAA